MGRHVNRASAVAFVFSAVLIGTGRLAHADCSSPANTVEAENCRPGSPPSEWNVSGAGDPNLQGFATDISVNRGETVAFKIDTTVSAYHIDIYRLGYYNGLGARKVATVPNASTLKTHQAACLTDAATGLLDCGNWSVSALWMVPADAVSGIYIARLVGASAPRRRSPSPTTSASGRRSWSTSAETAARRGRPSAPAS